MDISIHSRNIPTEFSSGKSYYVKRKGIKSQLSKEPNEFFKPPQYKEQQFHTPTHNSSAKLITMEDSIISSKNDININRFMTINPSNPAKSASDLISLTESHDKQTTNNAKSSFIQRLNSVSSFMDSVGKKRIQKKYVFQTVCDQSFNKSLVKKQIIIEDPDLSNPQIFNFLPQITKNHTTTHKNQILQNIMPRSSLSRNSSKFSENSPFHLIQSEMSNKFSMDKLKDYRKLWMLKERKRKEINEVSKLTEKNLTAAFHASLLQKSVNKSKIITQQLNQDVQLRKSKCYWQEQLRGSKKKYVTLGSTSSAIKGLKGNGQNPSINIQIRPSVHGYKKNFACQEVYKSHKSQQKPS